MDPSPGVLAALDHTPGAHAALDPPARKRWGDSDSEMDETVPHPQCISVSTYVFPPGHDHLDSDSDADLDLSDPDRLPRDPDDFEISDWMMDRDDNFLPLSDRGFSLRSIAAAAFHAHHAVDRQPRQQQKQQTPQAPPPQQPPRNPRGGRGRKSRAAHSRR